MHCHTCLVSVVYVFVHYVTCTRLLFGFPLTAQTLVAILMISSACIIPAFSPLTTLAGALYLYSVKKEDPVLPVKA